MVKDEFTAYAKRKIEDGQWSGKIGLGNQSIFDTFIDLLGNKPVTSITKADTEQYATVVNYLPRIVKINEPRKLPLIPSIEGVTRLIEASGGLKYKAPLSSMWTQARVLTIRRIGYSTYTRNLQIDTVSYSPEQHRSAHHPLQIGLIYAQNSVFSLLWP